MGASLPPSPQRTDEPPIRVVSNAVRGASVGLWSRDFESGVITYSSDWKALLGYAPDELENTHTAWEERLHPEDRDGVLATLNACILGKLPGCVCGQGAAYEASYRLRHRDGSYRWILARGTCQRDAAGRLLRISGSHVDITDLKQAEREASEALRQSGDALASSQMMFRTVFAAAGVGLAISDREGTYQSVNSAFCQLTGYAEDELLGITWRRIAHPDEHLEIARRRSDVLERNAVGPAVERRYLTKQGHSVWIRSQYCRIPGGADDSRLLIIAEDVTRQREADDALRRSVDQMRSLARRLQKVREEERARLAREIHDEFGQALTSMKLDAAALAASGSLDDGARARAVTIMNLADRSIESVRRIASDLRPGILDDLGLVAALEWAVDDFQNRLEIPCRLTVPSRCVDLSSERATALFRILQEALTNIARHARATAVRVRLFAGTDRLTLQVRDNGVGFSEADLAAGQSLGLLGMRERALIVGGELTIRSRPGDGTLLTVRIPTRTSANDGGL